MNCFLIPIVGLILGFFLYGSFVDRVFGPDSKAKMPALCKYDDVEFTPMPTWELFITLALAGINSLSCPAAPIIGGRVSLHHVTTGMRVKQNAKLEDLIFKTRIAFRRGAILSLPKGGRPSCGFNYDKR
jgi:hypothetical protein